MMLAGACVRRGTPIEDHAAVPRAQRPLLTRSGRECMHNRKGLAIERHGITRRRRASPMAKLRRPTAHAMRILKCVAQAGVRPHSGADAARLKAVALHAAGSLRVALVGRPIAMALQSAGGEGRLAQRRRSRCPWRHTHNACGPQQHFMLGMRMPACT